MRYLFHAIALLTVLAFLWVWQWRRSRQRRLIAHSREDRHGRDGA